MINGLNLDNLSVDENGRVSFSGLGSGIDLRGTVDAIISARRIPVDTLEARVDRNLTKISALETLQVGLESLRSSLSRLYGQVSFGNSNDIFSMKQAFASSFRIDGTAGSSAGNLMGVTVNKSCKPPRHRRSAPTPSPAPQPGSDSQTATSSPSPATRPGPASTPTSRRAAPFFWAPPARWNSPTKREIRSAASAIWQPIRWTISQPRSPMVSPA